MIKNVFTKEECDKIRKSAYEALNHPNSKYKHQYIEKKGEKPGLIFFPCLVEPYIDEIRKDSRLAKIAQFFLGDDIRQINNQIYFREAGDGDEFAWHQDICFRNPRERYPGIDQSYLQTIIAVDDITLNNSPVEFVPGSHKTGEHKLYGSADVTNMLRKFKRQGLKGKKYTCKAGDVMVWSVLTVHGSEKNESKGNRMTYMNGFAKADSALDWPYYMKGGKVVDIDHNLIP